MGARLENMCGRWGGLARGGGAFFFPEGVAHVQLKPVQETNLHFLYFVGFFQTVKKKKNFKKRK